MPTQTNNPTPRGNANFGSLAMPYAEAGFRRDILPIVPPNAVISSHSRKPEAIARGRGKLPGKLLSDGWVGFSDWTKQVTKPEDIVAWAAWPCGMGLQGRNQPGLDVDVDRGDVADAVEVVARRVLGPAPCRSTGASRRLLVYRGQGHRKRRMTFTLPGSVDEHAVELLGDGQFYVVEGTHKSGNPYVWQGGVSPADRGFAGLTEITAADLDKFFDRVERMLKRDFSAKITARASRKRLRTPGEKSISLAPSVAALRAVVAAIPNDDEIDYDDWVHIGLAIHAASRGSEDGYTIFEDWSLDYGGDNSPGLIRDKWESFEPEATGWDFLQRFARKYGFSGARWEFGFEGDGDAEQTATPDEPRPNRAERPDPEAEMFSNSVWLERLQLVMDLPSGDRLNREQFNARHFRVGDPSNTKECAWAQFLKQGERRRTAKSVTYRPGAPRFVFEASEGGECVNIWRPTTYAIPPSAAEIDARPWLDHLAFLLPDAGERSLLVRWFAWVVQNPEKKPNWGILIGSQHQGNGKSILTKPIRAALGDTNVREITVEDLASGYTDWLEQTKLFVVEEMHSFERTSAMNRLKNFLALPPHFLWVNPKFGKQYEVPNILAGLFFTNHRNALALEKTDRRFLVLWTDAEPREEAYYLNLLTWYDNGGAEKAARYLMDLELGDFNALGRAPETPAKTEMRKQSRPRLDEWIEEGLAEGQESGVGTFGAAIIALEDLRQSIPEEVCGKTGRPSPIRFATAMRNAGAVYIERVALGAVPEGVIPPSVDLQQARLYSLRNHQFYAAADRAELAALYWAERLRAQGGPIDGARLYAVR